MGYTEIQRARFIKQIKQLLEVVEAPQAPGSVVLATMFLGSLIQAGITLYGADVFNRLADGVTHFSKKDLGFCSACEGEPRRIDTATNSDLCDVCSSKAIKDFEDFDKG